MTAQSPTGHPGTAPTTAPAPGPHEGSSIMSPHNRRWPNGEPQSVRNASDKQPDISAAFGDAAAAHLREMYDERQREQLAAARDMTPGAPHPNPVLAANGWQASDHGTYVRRQAEHEREAG